MVTWDSKPDLILRTVLESATHVWGRYAPTLAAYVVNNNSNAYAKLNRWRNYTMARRTFTIELKVDVGDDQDAKLEPMKQIVKQFARDLLASSTLLSQGRKSPEVVAFTDDDFVSSQEISLLDPSDEVTDEVTIHHFPNPDDNDGLDV